MDVISDTVDGIRARTGLDHLVGELDGGSAAYTISQRDRELSEG
jgi:hypothetical protein